MEKAQFGLSGLGVMGSSLARNLMRRDVHVSVHNRTPEKVDTFVKDFEGEGKVTGCHSVEELVESLQTPRSILLLVPAGDPVDQLLEQLQPLLEKGDTVVDGGNSFFKDTNRREKMYKEKGLNFVGMGISGGEEGALMGPSLMPGGPKKSWQSLQPILEAIAADDFHGGKCVAHIGQAGAGHFVKMVHNGIEYADMQQISEVYDLMKHLYGMTNGEMAKAFDKWNKDKLNSFLTGISVEVLSKKDDLTDDDIIDHILDVAGQKGTGKWTSQVALDLSQPIGSITEAVFARFLSAKKDLRKGLGQDLPKPPFQPKIEKKEFLTMLQDAFLAARISNYAQGFEMMKAGDEEYKFGLDYPEIARIWEGGCIIRAKLLEDIRAALQGKYRHLFLDKVLRKKVQEGLRSLRTVVAYAAQSGRPAPSFMAALAYIDSLTTEKLPINMIQGLRDNFGAHTYMRDDRDGTFHTEW